ncbi:MAG TPA: glycosyl hydrolase [Acidobacteriaceae bacterium]|nr:glycosyl hydrolase [Acidobacteriaceae bacterium]
MLALLGASIAPGQKSDDYLARGFQQPPDSAKPRVWWHWMNGNVTKDGIKADLEWMNRVGIGGFQNFDASLGTPQIVQKRLVYMTPEWKDAFRYATTLADQLGLEEGVASSAGWNLSGGSWVLPAHAIKKYVWSETEISGGEPFHGVLKSPPSNAGPFQDLPSNRKAPDFYADSAVFAYRLPPNDTPPHDLPKIASSGGQFDLASLTDGDLTKATLLPAAPPNESSWIQFEYSKPQRICGLSIAFIFKNGDERRVMALTRPAVEASDDGKEFHFVADIPWALAQFPVRTIAFPPVTAKFFRVTFKTPPTETSAVGARISELALRSDMPINRFETKAAFGREGNLLSVATPPAAAGDAIRKSDVIDLTAKMHSDGTLDWTPPPGRWEVVRLGYSLIGIMNNPAEPEATGLEVDKLSSTYVREYFQRFFDNFTDATGGLMGKRGLKYVVTDSWEDGTQNWTDDMFAQFKAHRGYDMLPWLPVLTGHVVESSEASDRFLYDFRQTLADLVVENHYDQLTDLLHARGMGRYSESHEQSRSLIADGMEVKRSADIPMGAMWVPDAGPTRDADIRESASVAHIYGQNLVAAESFTTGERPWAWTPETLKPAADRELADGLNRFVIHTSVHQPLDDKLPGLGLGMYGQWFNRHDTWAELAKPWMTYLARSSYLLQQGKFVADVAYLYGQDANITQLFAVQGPEVPAGYNFDYVNSDVVLHRLSVKNGRLITPGGTSYRVLALDSSTRRMTLPVLRKLRELVNDGAVLVGPMPIDSPSLSDDQAEFKTIADQLFGSGTGDHSYGKGRVLAGQTLADALRKLNVTPDFQIGEGQPDTNLFFTHRRISNGEIYWVNNRNNRAETINAAFRVAGKAPELWHADTGKIEPASFRVADNRTIVPLRLGPNEAVFVVFRRNADVPSRNIPFPMETTVAGIDGPWKVQFQSGRGAPAEADFENLVPWTQSNDPGVKYFSGTATYTKSLQAPAKWFNTGARLWMDLGDVKNIAEVFVNGRYLGILWKPPFRVDVTGIIKPGTNVLEIKVTNLWVNRLIGDQQPDATKKYTYTNMKFYGADSPLLPSGLLGPVKIMRSVRAFNPRVPHPHAVSSRVSGHSG